MSSRFLTYIPGGGVEGGKNDKNPLLCFLNHTRINPKDSRNVFGLLTNGLKELKGPVWGIGISPEISAKNIGQVQREWNFRRT